MKSEGEEAYDFLGTEVEFGLGLAIDVRTSDKIGAGNWLKGGVDRVIHFDVMLFSGDSSSYCKY